MATMTISLPEPMIDLIEERVASGGYATSGDYVGELVDRDHSNGFATARATRNCASSSNLRRRAVSARRRSTKSWQREIGERKLPASVVSSASLTASAEADLLDIYISCIEQFGRRQSVRHVGEWRRIFQLLANSPKMGRHAKSIGPGIRRHEHDAHVILYTEAPDGVTILAIVGRSHHKRPTRRYLHPSFRPRSAQRYSPRSFLFGGNSALSRGTQPPPCAAIHDRSGGEYQ